MIEADQLAKTFRDKKSSRDKEQPLRHKQPLGDEPLAHKQSLITAVAGLTFRCEPGRVYGLLGVNGAGKTTTLRMLATILTPTSGAARVAGYDTARQPDKVRASIGFLSTATALYGRLTAEEMVAYFGRLHGMDGPRLRRRIDELFARLGMEDFRARRCDDLSAGMKQKASVARTLVHDPPVMIFDEPTAGLDVLTARTILDFIRECRQRGKTVLFSTHIMSEAEKLCDTIGILHDGRLLAEGSLAELRARYARQDLEDIFFAAVGA